MQNAFFHGKRHDNKMLKVKIVLSRNFVVMAQAPSLERKKQGFPKKQGKEDQGSIKICRKTLQQGKGLHLRFMT